MTGARLLLVGAALLLTGCSLLGLYDGTCCRLAPPGPPSSTGDGPTTFTLYNASGARLGTIVPQAGGRVGR